MKNYKVIFDIEGLDSKYNTVKELRKYMEEELIRVHNIFANKTNSGVTDRLNEEFKSLYPNYFEENRDKHWEDLIEYNRYIDDGYQRLVLNDFNKKHISPILNFKSELGSLVGYLRGDENVKIRFYLVKVD